MKHGLDSLHEVWPQLTLKVLYSIAWISQSFSIQSGLYMMLRGEKFSRVEHGSSQPKTKLMQWFGMDDHTMEVS